MLTNVSCHILQTHTALGDTLSSDTGGFKVCHVFFFVFFSDYTSVQIVMMKGLFLPNTTSDTAASVNESTREHQQLVYTELLVLALRLQPGCITTVTTCLFI